MKKILIITLLVFTILLPTVSASENITLDGVNLTLPPEYEKSEDTFNTVTDLIRGQGNLIATTYTYENQEDIITVLILENYYNEPLKNFVSSTEVNKTINGKTGFYEIENIDNIKYQTFTFKQDDKIVVISGNINVNLTEMIK